ncbi:uncharacterized protein BX663DRAFT_62074 [Cokeromyces recurvatus]|uniref:uncharacterized protein n=1 Tax=Cokeromyces recurvatus TaxID=90255 RepID=UPI00221F46B1|nr:uncharacterized protein BX663DRAFT_62074 [Cokeromyces recurvatus]KAI7902561.1 hypothetical protein BX663DRAFT_62074 [Cokeromyces recurvatus]
MSRRRIINDSESEEEGSVKRTKLDCNETSQRMDNNESNDDQESPDTHFLESDHMNEEEDLVPLLVDEDDGFVEGSIVKITLVNFVTYDYCEIYPGPQMNMIIGPNGTGKSTIVCAIALGLGGNPNLLGRAKNIAEFVKTGEDEATISIELKQVNVRNIIIQRSFRKSNNATTWRVNGILLNVYWILNLIA